MNKPLQCLLVVCAVLGARPQRAVACSGFACRDAQVYPEGGELPADWFTLAYSPARAAVPMDAAVVLPRLFVRNGASARTEVPLAMTPEATGSIRLAPTTTLASGSVVELVITEHGCTSSAADRTVEYTVGEAAPAPSTLGTSVVKVQRGKLGVAVWSGSCDEQIDAAYADIELAFSEQARKFRGLFRYAMIVDGQPYGSFFGSLGARTPEDASGGRDRVYAACKTSDRFSASPLSQGAHRVRQRATLPDGTTLETSDVEFTLSCASQDAGTDAGPPTRADASTTLDASSRTDASTKSDASTNADTSPATTASNEDGCNLPGTPHSHATWLTMLALTLLRRRRNDAQKPRP